MAFGQQAAQICHCLTEFGLAYPWLYEEWYDNSNYICLLQIPNEQALQELLIKAQSRNILTAEFYEPDFDNALTAICLEPGDETKQMLKHLQLAFK